MGREEIGQATGTVPTFICWFTYFASFASIAIVFLYPQHESTYWNGLISDILSTVVIFFFSCYYKNSSIYDPAWYKQPLFVCGFWFATSGNGVSIRGILAFGLVLLWCCRFIFQFPWPGYFGGLTHEDWRFVDF